MRELDDRMRAAAHLLPLYGVATWAGPVMTGDWDWENGEFCAAGLAHGLPGGPHVQVSTTAGDPGPRALSRRMAAGGAPRDAARTACWSRGTTRRFPA